MGVKRYTVPGDLDPVGAFNVTGPGNIPPAPVSSVFGRTGAVVAAAGDYTASKVDNDSSVAGATVRAALDALLAGSGVTSVFGRIGAVVAALGDYAASKVNNDSSVAGATTKDALNTLLARSGVASIFGRTGAVVAAVGDYTASKVNNDSSVAGATTKDALNTLFVAAPRFRGLYRTTPATPDAWNLNAETMTNPDLADPSNGWTVNLGTSPYTTCTRIGEVDFYLNPTSMSAGQYRSSLLDGALYIQIGGNASSVNVLISKPSSGQFAYASDVDYSRESATSLAAFTIADTVQWGLGTSKAIYTARFNSQFQLVTKNGGTSTPVYGAATGVADAVAHFLNCPQSAGNVNAYGIVAPTSQVSVAIAVTATLAMTPTVAGVLLQGASLPTFYHRIKYIRRYPVNTYFPLT